MPETAGLILLGARVHGARPDAQGVAITGSRISAVGTAAELRAHATAGTEVLEYPGATLLPGMNDAHAHVAAWGASRPPLAVDVSPRAVRSIAEVAEAVRAAAASQPPGTWIRGAGWDVGFLAECTADPRRRLTRHDLDAAAPDHPVILTDFSVHAIWVNSLALRIAGVTGETPTPSGGDITRDEHGDPEGVLAEFAAQNLVQRHVPELTRADRREAIVSAAAALNALGITSVTDPALGPGGGTGVLGTETLRAYEDLAAEGALRLRTSVLLLHGAEGSASATDIREGLATFAVAEQAPGSMLRTGGVKIFADGIPPLHTAWLHEDYADAPGRGSLVIPGADDADRIAELREMVRLAHAAGHQVGVHATGDAAIDAVVDAFAAAVEAHPREDARHYVIHGDLTYAPTLATMGRHGFGICTQPSIKTAAAHLADLFLGVERSSYQWPNRDTLDAGVPLVFSSDAPVVPPDWRSGVVAAVTRVAAATGEVSGPEQRITVTEAIDAYTRGGAWQDFAEHDKGRLEPGMLADVCVLGGDPYSGDPAGIEAMPILATVLDGSPVFVA